VREDEPADAVLEEAHVCGEGIAHDEKAACVEKREGGQEA
jgi:hypothetical protein